MWDAADVPSIVLTFNLTSDEPEYEEGNGFGLGSVNPNSYMTKAEVGTYTLNIELWFMDCSNTIGSCPAPRSTWLFTLEVIP